MSLKTVTYTTSATFTAPAALAGGGVNFDVRGANGTGFGTISPGGSGGKGARVRGFIPLAGSATLKIKAPYAFGGTGGTGTHHGGGGGTSAAILNSSTVVLVVAAGGGGGGYGSTQGYGSGGNAGTPTGSPGGTTYTANPGGGGNGASPGAGGVNTSDGVADGNVGYAPGSPQYGRGGAGGAGVNTYGGGGGGAGYAGGGGGAGSYGTTGGAGGGGGSSYTKPTTVTTSSVLYSLITGSSTALVILTYHVADPDLKPTVNSPANGTREDMANYGVITFTRNPGTQSGTMTGWAVKRQKVGTATVYYWKASTSAWTTSPVYNAMSYLTSLGSTAYSYTFPTGHWTDGQTYNWAVATQNHYTGHTLTGPFCTTLVVISVVSPTITNLGMTNAETAVGELYLTKTKTGTKGKLSTSSSTTATATHIGNSAVTTTTKWWPVGLGTAVAGAGVATEPTTLPAYSAIYTTKLGAKRLIGSVAWGITFRMKCSTGTTTGTFHLQVWRKKSTGTSVRVTYHGVNTDLTATGALTTSFRTVVFSGYLDPTTLTATSELEFALIFKGHGSTTTEIIVSAGLAYSHFTVPGLNSTPLNVSAVSRPFFGWTSEPHSTGTLAKYQAIVYTTAQTTSPGFSVGVTTGVWTSGAVSSSLEFVQVGLALTDLDTYVIYVRVMQTPTTVWSSWASYSFSLLFPTATAPSLAVSAAKQGTNSHPVNNLSATGTSSHSPYKCQIQRSLTGSGTWVSITTDTIVTQTTWSASYTDITAPFLVPVYYRARFWSTVTGQTAPSAWSNIVHDTLGATTAIARWWIVDPLTGATAIPLYRAVSQTTLNGAGAASIELDSNQAMGAFACFGRSNYVTVFGTLLNEEFTLIMDFLTTATYNEFLAFRAKQRVALIKSDMNGETYFVTFGPARPVLIQSASDRQTTPLRQVMVHCYPTTPVY